MGKRQDRKPASVRIGTSGWHYAGWWGPFYPEKLPKKNALLYYVENFPAVELNAPFYRMPTQAAVRGWFETTPEDFRFAWKASRFITHFRRLLVDDESLDLLASRIRLLEHKAGPVLFQLHPRMPVDCQRLATFTARLDPQWRYCFEFRHASWYVPAVFKVLRDRGMALCLSDHAAAPAPREVTADWIYIRNHGPSGRYFGSYGDAALVGWVADIARWAGEGKDVWCFFDNDVKSAAPTDARKLSEMVEAEGVKVEHAA